MFKGMLLVWICWLAVATGRPAPVLDSLQVELAAFPRTQDGAAESHRFERLCALCWDLRMALNPELATNLGDHRYDREWSDQSPGGIERNRKIDTLVLLAAQSIDGRKLSGEERVSYDLFLRNAAEAVDGDQFPDEYLQVDQLDGVQLEAPQTFEFMPAKTAEDLEIQLARLKALPAHLRDVQACLEEGLKRGITAPQITLRDVPGQFESHFPADIWAAPMLKSFKSLPSDLREEDRARLRQSAESLYVQTVAPAWKQFHRFLVEKYLPGARAGIAFTDLPNGPAWYAFRVRRETTLSLNPEEIHRIGLEEVARIGAEMNAIKDQTGFKGSLPEFFQFLRTDPRFYCTKKEELLSLARDVTKRIDAGLPRLFKVLPRNSYGVGPVPAYSEKSQTTAYYQPGLLAAGRSGTFCVNTYALNTRPTWELEALALHESVPGHHLQISLAQEIEGLPAFRRYTLNYTGFVEGWALYAESLGPELGMYEDPYSKFGQLTYEMWRAVRLVVDTGMHVKGWTRRQAIDYFLAHASKTENDVTVEIDRYLVWPGQALAYKLGQRKIRELRTLAEAKLGGGFDVREFHNQVLRNGAVPLDLLDKNVREWLGAAHPETK